MCTKCSHLSTIHISIAALGTLPHIADKTMEIGGYTIPRGSVIIGITTGIMHDPKVLVTLYINSENAIQRKR